MPPSLIPIASWNRFQFGLLWLVSGQLPETFQGMGIIQHPTAAWFLREGRITLTYSDGEEHFETGDWIFLKEAPALVRFSGKAEMLALRFFAHTPDGRPLFDRTGTVRIKRQQAPGLLAVAERLEQQLAAWGPCRFHDFDRHQLTLRQYLEIQKPFAEWVLAWADVLEKHGLNVQSGGELTQEMGQCIDYLERRDLSTPFREEELSGQFGISAQRLREEFRRVVGHTPVGFWSNRRMNVAQWGLSHTRQSIKEIAYHLGFCTPEHFSNWFRKRTGFSPRTYRARRLGV